MHVCLVLLSVRPSCGTAQLTPHGFSWTSIFEISIKIRDTFWFWLQLYKNVKLFTWRSKYTHVDWLLWFSLWATSQAGKPGSDHRSSSLVVINNCGQAVSRRSRTAETQIRSLTSPYEMWWTEWYWGTFSPATSAFPCDLSFYQCFRAALLRISESTGKRNNHFRTRVRYDRLKISPFTR